MFCFSTATWFRERASVLRHTYIACNVQPRIFTFKKQQYGSFQNSVQDVVVHCFQNITKGGKPPAENWNSGVCDMADLQSGAI
jgi:hypothetical protein